MLTSPSHKALPINTDPAAPPVHPDVTDAQTITPGIQNDVVDTPATVSDSQRSGLKRPGDPRGQKRAVSMIYSICRRVTTDPRPASRQVSDLCWKWYRHLTSVSSAPGDSSAPLPASTHGTISGIHRDIRAIASQLERNATNTQTMVSVTPRTAVGGQESNDSRDVLVSKIRTLSIIE